MTLPSHLSLLCPHCLRHHSLYSHHCCSAHLHLRRLFGSHLRLLAFGLDILWAEFNSTTQPLNMTLPYSQHHSSCLDPDLFLADDAYNSTYEAIHPSGNRSVKSPSGNAPLMVVNLGSISNTSSLNPSTPSPQSPTPLPTMRPQLQQQQLAVLTDPPNTPTGRRRKAKEAVRPILAQVSRP